jgi:hypothetical protein
MAKDTCGECRFFESEACNLRPRKPTSEACDEFYRKRKKKARQRKPKPQRKVSGICDEGPYETIFHNGKPMFLVKTENGFKIAETVTNNGKEIVPKQLNEIPYEPYGYEDGAIPNREDLFWRVRDEFDFFLDVESIYKDFLAACVLLSYQQEKLRTVPYVYFYGDNESGKTVALTILSKLSYRPLFGVTIPSSDIYGYLDDVDSPGVILEDEIQGFWKDLDKSKIYKAGYKKGAVVPRYYVTPHGRFIRYYRCFCFKAVAAERIPTIKGLNERFIFIPMVEGYPRKDWSDTDEEDLKRIRKLRNDLLKWRLATRTQWQIPEVELPVKGRLKELWKPIIQIVSGLPIEETLRNFLEELQKQRLNERVNTLEGHIVKVIVEKLYKGKNEPILFSEIWEALLTDLEGKIDEKKTYKMHTLEFDEVTKNKVGYRLREILNGKRITLRTEQGNVKAYKFNEEKLKRIAKKYGYTLHTKLPSELSSQDINQHKSPSEINEKHTFISQKLGALSNSVCKLTKIDPYIDRCSHCQRVEVLHWQVETFKGKWGHICQDCYGIFSEIMQKKMVA